MNLSHEDLECRVGPPLEQQTGSASLATTSRPALHSRAAGLSSDFYESRCRFLNKPLVGIFLRDIAATLPRLFVKEFMPTLEAVQGWAKLWTNRVHINCEWLHFSNQRFLEGSPLSAAFIHHQFITQNPYELYARPCRLSPAPAAGSAL